jgi:hypothetical protein
MATGSWGLAVAGVAMVLVSACSSTDQAPRLMNLRSGPDGPDEFAILPPKALENPADMTVLPEPTPGGGNRTDPNPQAEAIAALGGKAGNLGGTASDRALIAYAARGGVAADIRTELAQEDLQFRQKNQGRPLERLFAVPTYFRVYGRFALNAYDELARWRAAGVATPSAPPRPKKR